MPSDNPIILRIKNECSNTPVVTINGVQIASSAKSWDYVLQLPVVQIQYLDSIQITLFGAEENNQNPPSKGMCLCLTPDSTVSLTLTESMHIAINTAYIDKEPEGVHCGDGL